MDKEQFMELLDYYFRNVDATTYAEIKNDYEEHFRIGLENGKTEAEISSELGNPREIFNECKEAGIIKENNLFTTFNLENIGDFLNSKIFNQRIKEKDYDLSQQVLEFDNNFHRIEVRTNADVDVETHDEDKIIVTYTSTDESYKLDVDEENHVLKLGQIKMEKLFAKDSIRTISIKIPQDSDLGLNIATARGDIKVDVINNDVTCNTSSGDVIVSTNSNDVNVNTASGDVSVSNCKKNVLINTVSGDVKITSSMPEISVNTVSGDMNIDLEENRNLDLTSVSGDVYLNIKEKKGSVNLKTLSGEIRFESSYKDNSKKVGKAHSHSFTTEEYKINIGTVSGDAYLS